MVVDVPLPPLDLLVLSACTRGGPLQSTEVPGTLLSLPSQEVYSSTHSSNSAPKSPPPPVKKDRKRKKKRRARPSL